MKQVLKNLRDGRTIVADVPVPTPGPGMVLVRNFASLVSVGTERMLVSFAEKSLLGKARARPDLMRQVWEKVRREGVVTALETALNRLDQPIALGYSSAGIVVEVGEGVRDLHPGDPVACAGGGYAVHAEYVVVPRLLVTRLPEGVDFESGAFVTLGAIALHGFRLADTQLGETVAVIGLGVLGLLTLQIAKASGCQGLGIDVDPWRVEKGRMLGLMAVPRTDAESTGRALTQGRGFDAVIICADTPSNDPVELAGHIARDRGRVVAVGAVGLELPRKLYYEKELSFVVSRSYGPGRYDPAYEEKGQDYPLGYVRWTEGRNLEAVANLIGAGLLDVKSLITHRFPIDAADQAYTLITTKGADPSLGVLITYPQSEQFLPSTKRINLRPPKEPLVSKVRLGVLGAGNYATVVFLPMIRSFNEVEKVGIVSMSGLHARHAAEKFGFAFASSDENEIWQDATINTVAILTRHNHHARQVEQALTHGKHTFCEKPLAITWEEVERLEALLYSEDLPLLTVGFNRRFAPLAERLKTFLANRGQPMHVYYRVNAGYLPPNHWLHDPHQGGGRLIGEGCHFVDFLVYLIGNSPTSVEAVSLPDNGVYREDNFSLMYEFADGSVGLVSYLANGDKSYPKERIEVFCEGKIAILDDFRTLEIVVEGRRQVFRQPLRQDKGHRGLWGAFMQAITTTGLPPIPYDQILGVTKATLAAREALRTRRRTEI
jgi:predicted dehydrogenase/threonine dehydrogenase-like Zn-dependent dehydrogenase